MLPHLMMLSRLLSAVLFITSWCVMGLSHAALPPLKTMVEVARSAQAAPRDVDVTYVEEAANAPSRKALRIRTDAVGMVRLDTQDLATGSTRHQVWRREGEEWILLEGDRGVPPARESLSELPTWIRWFMGEDLLKILDDLGVDKSRVSLAHDGSIILWVVGAGPTETDRSQIHVERRGGALRRLVEITGEGDTRRLQSIAFDRTGDKKSEEPPAHGWPPAFVVTSGGKSTRYVIRRWVERPVFAEETFHMGQGSCDDCSDAEPPVEPTSEDRR